MAQGLNIIIVGSGLAGLTAARILREHHKVTVYERGSPDTATGGQGIILAPNGIKILDQLGYDRHRAGAVPITGLTTYNKDGRVLEEASMDLKGRFGVECEAMKRSDFREELLRLATASSATLGIGGETARMVFDNAIVAIDPEEGVVELDDGSRVEADVLIVADGVHSRLRSSITGDPNLKAKKTGLTCYRIAISHETTKAALGDQEFPAWWNQDSTNNHSSIIYAGDGSARVITTYPICRGTHFNISCILKRDDQASDSDSWHADGDKEAMVAAFSDFEPALVAILDAATEVKVWDLQDLGPLPTWTKGRAMLIGDAAHAMTPMQGQGANMSIEDAESLRLLTPDSKREDVPQILKLAESIRRPRVAQVLSETRKSHSTTGVAERAIQNLEFNCSYGGIFDALARQEGQI